LTVRSGERTLSGRFHDHSRASPFARPTALLDADSTQLKVSTGIATLDHVLGGLYWGDNVVWDVDHASADDFYAAIAELPDAFEMKAFIALDGPAEPAVPPHMPVIAAGPGTALARPADVLHEIQRLCHGRGRRLLLFDSLDKMVRAWGATTARGFFARCCPLLLEASAIAYWTMSADHTPQAVRDAVTAVTQCILHVDDRSVRVTKAEGREDRVAGSVLHWHQEGDDRVLEAASITGRVAASLRALRRARDLSQHDLAKLAGVTPNAISQAERGERGLSLTTMARLSDALGITIDDLLRGEDPRAYRIGRRVEDPQRGIEPAMTLVDGAHGELRVDLIQLGPRQAGHPVDRQAGSVILAVASGMVQVEIAGQTPAVRHGEVLIADGEQVTGWRNVGHGDAMLFCIALPQVPPSRPHRPVL
jgi:transcriptional regulator with XRE-family HTH domain